MQLTPAAICGRIVLGAIILVNVVSGTICHSQPTEATGSIDDQPRHPVGGKAASKELEQFRERGSAKIVESIDKFREQLSAESFDQTVERLNDQLSYMWPGYHTERQPAEVDIETLLSNRRVIRFVELLSERPNNEQLCRELFEKAFAVHCENVERCLKSHEDVNAERNDKSIFASKFAVCAIIYGTAENRHASLVAKQIATWNAHGKTWRNRTVGSPAFEKAFWGLMSHFIMPDMRFEANVLLVSLIGDAGKEELTHKIAEELSAKKIVLVSWNAKTTFFDIPHKSQGIPIDTSKGARDVVLYNWGKDVRHNKNAQSEIVLRLIGIASGD